MKIYSIILSMSFFTTIAMDDSGSWFSSFNFYGSSDDKGSSDDRLDYYLHTYDHPCTNDDTSNIYGYGDDESASSIGEESKHEENDTETGPYYANCPLCYRFFKKDDKRDMREALKEHLEAIHSSSNDPSLSDTEINEHIRNFIGYLKIEYSCPFFDSFNKKGRKCTFCPTHVVYCDTPKKPFHHLLIHLEKFHSRPTNPDALVKNKDAIKISGPLQERPALFSTVQDVNNQHAHHKKNKGIQKEKICFPFLQAQTLKKKRYVFMYTCPLWGQPLKRKKYTPKRPKGELCHHSAEIIKAINANTTDQCFKRCFDIKIYAIVSNMWRHLCEQHPGSWARQNIKKWRKNITQECISWKELEDQEE